MTNGKDESEAGRSDAEKDQPAQQQIEQDKRKKTRRHERFELETEVTVFGEIGLLPGRTVDVSESGVSAILPGELQIGEIVELTIKLPIAVATVRAVVRNRNVYRHGFEFLHPMHDVVWREAAAADCQSCGGTGFVMRAVNGRQGVAFMRIRCSNCGGAGLDSK